MEQERHPARSGAPGLSCGPPQGCASLHACTCLRRGQSFAWHMRHVHLYCSGCAVLPVGHPGPTSNSASSSPALRVL